MSASAAMPGSLVIRRATPKDADPCGVICYNAFAAINKLHNFPPDLPAPEAGQHVLGMMFSHPGFFCVVAEHDGKIIGSNCLDERTPIAGVGPITVDPQAQNVGAGRQLMLAVMNRAAERQFAGVRLVQAAFHGRSMSLYAKLGFDVQEPLVVMQGPAIHQVPGNHLVRAAQMANQYVEELRRTRPRELDGVQLHALGMGARAGVLRLERAGERDDRIVVRGVEQRTLLAPSQ